MACVNIVNDSDYSSDEEIFAEFLEWERRPYTVKQRLDHFTLLDDVEFVIRFRLSKNTVLQILALIEEDIETPTDRNHSIPPIIKLLLTLRFFALGSMLITVADFSGVSKSSASNIVKQVSFAIARLSQNFIKMPSTEQEIEESQLKFYRRARMPKVIASLDCTHVKIQSPGGVLAETFRNRKGYFSLNIQTLTSENLKFMDVVARWPGSVHDQTILNSSIINQRLNRGEFGESLIVADSGYANTQFIFTPFLNTPTLAHRLYNESIIRTRNPVERSYGVWKRRFPVLSLGMRLKTETIQAIIIATAVLHNIAIDQNCPLPEDEIANNIDIRPWDPLLQIQNDLNNNARDQLLHEYFATMY